MNYTSFEWQLLPIIPCVSVVVSIVVMWLIILLWRSSRRLKKLYEQSLREFEKTMEINFDLERRVARLEREKKEMP